MPDLSSVLSTLRKNKHQVRGFLSIFVGPEVLDATVDIVGSTYPAVSVIVTVNSGTLSDVERDMRVDVFTAGGDFKGRLRARGNATSGSNNYVLLEEYSRGTVAIDVGDTIKVYNDYRPRSRLPFNDQSFAPDTITYIAQNTIVPPIANGGGPWAGRVDDGLSYATVDFDGSDSFAVDSDSGGSLTHDWQFPTGSTPASSTSATPTGVQLPAGEHVIEYTATDASNSETDTKKIPVRVHDDSDPPVDVIVESLEGSEADGWTATFTVLSNLSLTDMPDGALVMFWVEEYNRDGAVSSYGNHQQDRSHMKFVGWVRRDKCTTSREGQVLKIEAVGPLVKLNEMSGFSKVFIDDAAAANWLEYKDLSVNQAIISILRWYTSVLKVCDLIFDNTDQTYPRFYEDKNTPYEQCKSLADSLDCRFVADRSGRLMIQHRLELTELADRSALTTTLTLDPYEDIIRIQPLEREHHRPIELLEFEAIDGDGNSYFAWWPGIAFGNGTQRITVSKIIALSQSEANIRAGLRGAAADRIYTDGSGVQSHAPVISLELHGALDVFDFYREWVVIDVDSTYNRREIDLTTWRWIIDGISIVYEEMGATTRLRLKAETAGEPGQTKPQDAEPSSTVLPAYDSTLDFDSYSLAPDPFASATFNDYTDNIIAVLNDGTIARTSNFTTEAASGGPNYTNPSISGLSGTILTFSQDVSSATKGDAAWLLCSDGIYYVTGLTGASPSATLQQSWSETMNRGGIDSSYTFDNGQFVVAVVGPAIGSNDIRIAYTSDGGSNWTVVNEDRLGNAHPSVHIDLQNAGTAYLFSQYDTLPYLNRLHKLTDYGSTINTITTIPGDVRTGGGGSNLFIPFAQNSTRYGFYDGGEALVRADFINEDYIGLDILNNTAAADNPGPTAVYGLEKNMISGPSSDPNRLFVIGANDPGAGIDTYFGLFYSTNALAGRPSFETVYHDNDSGDFRTNMRGVYAVDTNNDQCYVFGLGMLGLFEIGAGIDDRTGDLVTSAKVLGLIAY